MARESIARRFRDHFGVAPDVVASAPGRVNLIGEHTDYNDGFVLPMAIDRRIRVAASSRSDGVMSISGDARYPTAVLSVFSSEYRVAFRGNLFIDAGVPMGVGLASSAAVEIAVLRAVVALENMAWDPMAMARIAQRAENDVLGVRCGIMDQAASALGRAGHAMLLDCRTLGASYVEVPEEVSVVVMDTGVRRKLSSTEYNERRAACERAVERLRVAAPNVRALRDVTPGMLDAGAAGLDPTILRRARHVVQENRRPAALVRALRERDFRTAGALMNESHASLRELYEVSSSHLDLICDAARAHPACYGSRMTGAGFGGCAIALVRSDATTEFMRAVQPRYEASTYAKSNFFVVTADDGATLEEAS